MKRVKFEDLVINLSIILKEKYNISTITSTQVDVYKKLILNSLKSDNNIVNIDKEDTLKFKEKYSEYFDVDIIYDDFVIYKIKNKISLKELKKKITSKIPDVDIDSLNLSIVHKEYNRLVRDNIPKKLREKVDDIKISVLEKDRYREELYNNLERFYQNFINEIEIDDKINNGIDLIEILFSIMALETEDDNFNIAVSAKEYEDGSFDKRLFLEEISYDLNRR